MARKKNGSDVDARIQALKEDFDELQTDVGKLLASLGEAASTGASDAITGIEQYAGQGVGNVRSAIRDQPLTAIALSMGAGALIGSLMRR